MPTLDDNVDIARGGRISGYIGSEEINFICNESNGDSEKDEKWTKVIEGMTIYKDSELKMYLQQAEFQNIQIHKTKRWLCVTAQKGTQVTRAGYTGTVLV